MRQHRPNRQAAPSRIVWILCVALLSFPATAEQREEPLTVRNSAVAKILSVITPELADRIRASADDGDASSQMLAGYMSMIGVQGTADRREANRWFLAAAQQENTVAQYEIALALVNGRGLERNEAEGAAWMTRAAEQGSLEAQTALGLFYQEGTGVEKSVTSAMHWFRKASDRGFAAAQCNLGWLLRYGEGVEHDYDEAFRLMTLAAHAGERKAQHYLGTFYLFGDGTPKNLPEAARWFLAAATMGHEKAQVALGRMYRHGIGVPTDPIQAYVWLSIGETAPGFDEHAEAATVASALTAPQLEAANALLDSCRASGFSACSPALPAADPAIQYQPTLEMGVAPTNM